MSNQENSEFVSLNQGYHFNKKRDVNNRKHKYKFKEGFTSATLKPTSTESNDAKDLQDLQDLQSQYDDLLTEYNKLTDQIKNTSQANMDRISPNNPYLSQNITLSNSDDKFPVISSGTGGYVTSQGMFKNYPDIDTYNASAGKNGCPTNVIQNIPLDKYSKTLLQGKDMISGQSCGNEGSNVYVNTMVSNPSSTYIGCYNNNLPPSTEVMFVPKMNSSNSVNGYNTYASSVYQNNNGFTGPWCAFDQNINTWWHTYTDSASNNYDSNTGQYTGTTSIPFTNSSGAQINVKGEWLQINLPGVGTSNSTNIPLTRYEIQGRQGCCGNPNGRDPNTWYILGWTGSGWQQIDYQTNISFNFKMLSFNVSNPIPCSAYMILTTVAGDNKAPAGSRSCVQIGQWNLYTGTPTNKGDAMIDSKLGYTTLDKCQTYANDNSNQFYSMQGQQPDGTAMCLVSNDETQIISYGQVDKQITMVPLWASNTANGSVKYTTATISASGQITLSAPTGETKTLNDGIQGCTNVYSQTIGYDAGGNDLSYMSKTTVDKCKTACINDTRCVGIVTRNDNECWLKSNINKRQKNSSVNLYSLSRQIKGSICSFFMALQSDGNFCVYKGTPSDNKGGVWCTMTNGKQENPNSDWTASNGKFGKPYLLSGQTLATDEWIGSDDGSLKLIMQSDGNLVLYTSIVKPGCSKDAKSGKTYGNTNINAVYKMDNIGYQNNLGNIGYVDKDAILHQYPSKMLGYSTEYAIYDNFDSGGNDIIQMKTNGIDGCKTECNKNDQCAGFVFEKGSNICYLKNSGMYPKSLRQTNNKLSLAVRKPSVINSNINMTEIDSIRYENYQKGDNATSAIQYNEPVINDDLRIQLEQNQAKQTNISTQIADKMTQMYAQDQNLPQKMNMTNDEFKNQIKKYNSVNISVSKLLNTNNPNPNVMEGMQNLNIHDINGMLLDSDMRILQENYGYIFWSILAVGLLTVTMNVMKK
jgi:hypothetical protein